MRVDEAVPARSDFSVGQRAALHFVGFRDDRYWNAVKVWGKPDFYHITWDRYAVQDVAPGDIVVFAKGDWQQEPRSYSGPDLLD